MNEDVLAVLPRWMQEFRRFQSLKSQFFLYGNVYDCYFCPDNYHQVGLPDTLKWKRFHSITLLLLQYLRLEGYELRCTYDMVDGVTVQSDDPALFGEGLVSFADKAVPGVAAAFSRRTTDLAKIGYSDAISLFRALAANTEKLFAGIITFTSRFSANPNHLSEQESKVFVRMVKAAREACVFPDDDAPRKGKRNLLVFVCDKLSDIPSWVLLENPFVKGIEVGKPSREERLRFFHNQLGTFHTDGAPFDKAQTGVLFADLTDGFFYHQLENVATISNHSGVHVSLMRDIVDQFKYGTREKFWEKIDKTRLDTARDTLRKRVIGQDQAIERALQMVNCARYGLNTIEQPGHKNRPKGVLFFAGPTGVGKTELAKSLAELIFNDSEAVIRFDMSEYNAENSDVKLIGAPPGYVGYEEGGQLTAAVKAKPFSIVLFDEIEKAHRIVFDKFLQILDDGRLTDGRGETVYFSETLIIFTSNLGMLRFDQATESWVENITYDEALKENYEFLRNKIMEQINHFFVYTLKRPEVLNRFGDNFVVFDFIKPDSDRAILVKNLESMRYNLKQKKNCDFSWDDSFIELFRTRIVQPVLKQGGRGILNMIDSHIKQGIAALMAQRDQSENLKFRVFMEAGNDKEVKFECF